MLNIEIKTIPDKEHRYDTVGDYWKKGDKDEIRISEMGNRQYEFFVAIHEMIEQFLCENKGITDEEITKFDIEYEKKRKVGDASEPGDDIYCPCHREHVFATKIERLMAEESNIDWDKYNNYINKFYKKRLR